METPVWRLVRTHRIQQVIEYPESPATLRAKWPAIYDRIYKIGTPGEFSPVACPLDEGALKQLTLRLPARKTHASVSLSIKLHSVAKKSQLAIQSMMQQQVLAMCIQTKHVFAFL